MKRRVIAGAFILGLGAVTLAIAQQQGAGTSTSTPRPATSDGSRPRMSDNAPADRAELHDRVARLRAEVEALQLEHDLARERLSAGLKEQAEGIEGGSGQQVARDYMRIGAELVGKGTEFESAMQEKGEEIWKAVTKAVGTPSPADLDRLKREFLRIATELNRRKIDLVELEIHLDASL